MNTIWKKLSLAAVAGATMAGVIAVMPSEAQADKTVMCRMKGTWKEKNDSWEFDAVYTIKNGPDTFRGVYENPGEAKADVLGTANNGIWTILLTYTDAKHANMSKKLIGKGTRDTVKNELIIDGAYKTFIGANDIKADGTFTFHGKCK
jgi:hypothetical protein